LVGFYAPASAGDGSLREQTNRKEIKTNKSIDCLLYPKVFFELLL